MHYVHHWSLELSTVREEASMHINLELDISSVTVMEDIVGASVSEEWTTQYLYIYIFPQTDRT